MKMLPFVRAASLTPVAAPAWAAKATGGPLIYV